MRVRLAEPEAIGRNEGKAKGIADQRKLKEAVTWQNRFQYFWKTRQEDWLM